MTGPWLPAGGSSSSSSPTTTATPFSPSAYRPADLAMVYPTGDKARPIAVAVQVDGVLRVSRLTLQHAAGLAATLANLVATEIERGRR